METEFLLEKRLAALRPELSENFKSVVVVMNQIMNKTISLFSGFTDHTIRHSLIVMEMANQIIGADQIGRLNADEIYILLCAAFMHDFGMTIGEKDYNEMKSGIVQDWPEGEDFNQPLIDTVRKYHNFFSEKLIYKYAPIFEFPSEEYMHCVAKVAKGHRVTNLYDEEEYAPAYRLPNGNIVHLPYLASMIRLCDEMDITIERNSLLAYAEHADILSYRQHYAIKQLTIGGDRFTIRVETGEADIREACDKVIKKLNRTLQYCVDVVQAKSDFEIRQKRVEVVYRDLGKRTAIILDSDIGTDDAMALSLIRKMGDFKPQFIIATPGNANASQAVVNAAVLKKMFGIRAVIVKGEAPEDIQKMAEKNTFHGKDGLAGISKLILEKYQVQSGDLAACISMDELKKRLLEYDKIIYLAICPLNSFCSLYGDAALKDKFERLYIMGGGLRQFNCSHNTEFNFSKAPKAVKQVLSSGLDITLFPLDFTNGQFLTAEDITKMAENGANPFCIAFLEHNRAANAAYNAINGAVLHDVMPLLYFCAPYRFTLEEKHISSDEYGAIREDPNGTAVKVAVSVKPRLLQQAISESILL